MKRCQMRDENVDCGIGLDNGHGYRYDIVNVKCRIQSIKYANSGTGGKWNEDRGT